MTKQKTDLLRRRKSRDKRKETDWSRLADAIHYGVTAVTKTDGSQLCAYYTLVGYVLLRASGQWGIMSGDLHLMVQSPDGWCTWGGGYCEMNGKLGLSFHSVLIRRKDRGSFQVDSSNMAEFTWSDVDIFDPSERHYESTFRRLVKMPPSFPDGAVSEDTRPVKPEAMRWSRSPYVPRYYWSSTSRDDWEMSPTPHALSVFSDPENMGQLIDAVQPMAMLAKRRLAGLPDVQVFTQGSFV